MLAQKDEKGVVFAERGFAFLSEAIRFHINFNLP
jgi:hypothetical protein